MEQVEQAGGRFDQVARGAEAGVARHARNRSGIRRRRLRPRQPQRLGRRVMAGELPGRLDPSRLAVDDCAGDPRSDRAGAARRAAGQRDDRDSRPRAVGPPSTISGIRPPRLASTWSARVGLIRPLALAEGAASGLPVARAAPASPGWAGTRSAIVGRPAVTSAGDAGVRRAAARPASAAPAKLLGQAPGRRRRIRRSVRPLRGRAHGRSAD